MVDAVLAAGSLASASSIFATFFAFTSPLACEKFQLFDFMPAWPHYIPILVGIGIVSMFVCYAPFFIADRLRSEAGRQA